jgi:hypothetical protein
MIIHTVLIQSQPTRVMLYVQVVVRKMVKEKERTVAMIA